MTAAYRLKGIGWFAVLVGIVLGFYLISLRVASERKKLDDVSARIASARRDIRALETEFDTRANLAQLEKWNGDTLALAAPAAGQYVRDDAALASLDPGAAAGPAGAEVRTAALVVPSLTQATPPPATAPAAAAVAAGQPVNLLPANFTRATPSAVAGQPVNLLPASLFRAAAAARPVAPAGRNAPAHGRPQTVAMLDRKLLSDTTFGDIMAGARAEARHR